MPETKPEITRESSGAAISAKIIAIAVLFGCIYYASSVVITLIFSMLIASVLEPGAGFLERLRLPRWLSSLIMVLLMLTVGYLVVYGIYDRALGLHGQRPQAGGQAQANHRSPAGDRPELSAEHAHHHSLQRRQQPAHRPAPAGIPLGAVSAARHRLGLCFHGYGHVHPLPGFFHAELQGPNVGGHLEPLSP